DDDALRGRARFLNPIHELALVIALTEIQREAERGRAFAAHRLELRERRLAVDVGFAGPEQIYVRSVEDENEGIRHPIFCFAHPKPRRSRRLVPLARPGCRATD